MPRIVNAESVQRGVGHPLRDQTLDLVAPKEQGAPDRHGPQVAGSGALESAEWSSVLRDRPLSDRLNCMSAVWSLDYTGCTSG